jgi:glutathione S-transferase
MTESAAICQYLASRYGPSPMNVAPEEPGYFDKITFIPCGARCPDAGG